MKKTFRITYTDSMFKVYKQLTVMGTQAQAERFAYAYAEKAHLMSTKATIREIA